MFNPSGVDKSIDTPTTDLRWHKDLNTSGIVVSISSTTTAGLFFRAAIDLSIDI
jgi:hypothetical protein